MVYKYDSHLSLRSGTYYFARRVPSDLINHYRSSRISYSLRTRSVRLASSRARVAADKLDDYWFHLRVQTSEIPALHLLHELKLFFPNIGKYTKALQDASDRLKAHGWKYVPGKRGRYNPYPSSLVRINPSYM